MRLFKKKAYWYECKFSYKVDGVEMLNFTCHIGVTKQRDVLNHRKLRCSITSLHLDERIPKKYLNNGNLQVSVCTYLGRFAK